MRPRGTRINADIPIGESLMPMAEYGGTLYIVSTDEIFASGDSGGNVADDWSQTQGDTLLALSSQMKTHARSTMYLALRDEGIYRSTDGGTQWHLFNDGLANKTISTVATVEKNSVLLAQHAVSTVSI